ncbi:glycosyltransferase family 4 protein [Thiocapsa rosea]|uniref:(1->4)-alpha-D-glucan synthase (UDP-glucose) n=1 Tax=Thiocapsa rosea TaxID=69360 RepID=A0A495V500_9GAMM|nr:glycosyltransferase family 4 protein [Thiocapsa rosea]RKT44482.1 (1->4)-alpha-D-glucan synthase (UDP-glucose) [Thiocapsa rosea]
MKLLFVSNLYPPNVVGGYERLCYEIAEALVARGHEVRILTSNYGEETAEYPGQQIDRSLKLFADDRNIYRPFSCTAEQRAEWSAQNVAEFHRVVSEFRPERIFVWNLYFFDPSLLDAIKASGIVPVYLLTDNWLIAFLNPKFIEEYMRDRVFGKDSQHGSPALLERLRIAFGRIPFRLPGHAIFASRFMQRLYREAGFGFEGSDIVYHGVHLHPHGGVARARDRLRQAGQLRLLVAGRVVEIKGVHTAVEALPAIRAALPNLEVRLSIIGDSQDDAYLKRLCELAEDGGCRDAIEFLPPVPAADLSALFDAHDIYLFPSLYEPFSLTLISGLHAGIPTVASDAGGNIEIVADSQTGLQFPRGDAAALAECVRRLVAEPETRARIAEGGAARAGQHEFSNMVAAIELALERAR